MKVDPDVRDAVFRELAYADFYTFVRWMYLKRKGHHWIRGPHHQVICDALMRVYLGQSRRLIINVAPRYSKTELAVINFIAWTLGRHPDSEYIHPSYSGKLASHNAFQTRELVCHPEYQAIFPDIRLRTDSKAKDDWRTTQGGVVYAAGTAGTITGYGAGKMREGFGGAVIIDDPHKPDEILSEKQRENQIGWFQNTLESRLNSPDTPIILIMQRLHEEDLAGWLLGGGNGEDWDLVKIPTLKPDGTALWPEKHSAETLARMQKANEFVFTGQYQQESCRPGGNVFKPGNIELVGAVPAGTKFVRGWDLASCDGSGDWTAGPKLGKTPDGRYIIADMVREQHGPEDVEKTLKNTADRDGNLVTIRLVQDPGQAGKAQIKGLHRLLSGYPVKYKVASGDKVTNAMPFAAQVNVGNVLMVRGEWNDALVGELRRFPNGKHDDQVDGLSVAFDELTGGNIGLLDFYGEELERIKAEKCGQTTIQ